MGMAELRSSEQIRNGIADMLEELRAVHTLERINKKWLTGDFEARHNKIKKLLERIGEEVLKLH